MLSTQHSWSLIPYLLSLFFNPLTSYVLEPSEKNFVSINSKFTHNIRDVSAHLSAGIYHYHLPSSISKHFRHLWLSFLAKIVDNFSCSLFLKKWYIAMFEKVLNTTLQRWSSSCGRAADKSSCPSKIFGNATQKGVPFTKLLQLQSLSKSSCIAITFCEIKQQY